MKQSILLSILILIVASLTGCATDQTVKTQAVAFNSGLQPAIMEIPELSTYLQQVGDRIIHAAKDLDQQGYGPATHKKEDNSWMFSSNMKFHLVNSKTVNAFTTGGEHMYIYNALFQLCDSEDELAAVMAHEYGHVYCRHVQSGMNRQYALQGGLVGAQLLGNYASQKTGNQYADAAVNAAGPLLQIVGAGYTRNDEDQADETGLTFYTHAGWDPNHFADFFKKMISMGMDKGPEFLSDHPLLSNRVKKAEQRVAAFPPAASQWRKAPIADPQQFAALKTRAAALAAQMPDDSKLQNSQQLLAALPRSCWTSSVQPDQKQAQAAILKKAQDAEARQQAAQKK